MIDKFPGSPDGRQRRVSELKYRHGMNCTPRAYAFKTNHVRLQQSANATHRWSNDGGEQQYVHRILFRLAFAHDERLTIVQTIFGGGNGGRVGNCVNRSDSISTVSIFATDVVVSTGRVGIVEQE